MVSLKNSLIILTAFIIGVVVALPHLYGIWQFGENYWGLTDNEELVYLEEETYIYSARAHQVLKGFFTGESYVWEYRFAPSPFLGELAAILPISFLSLLAGSIAGGLILSDFVFPLLLFLLIYWGLKKNNYPTIFSICVPITIIFAPFISSLIPYPKFVSLEISGSPNSPLFFSRTPYPQVTSLFLFGYIFLFTQVLDNPRKKIIKIWSTVLGLMLYLLPFIGSSVLFATGLLSKKILKVLNTQLVIISIAFLLILALPAIYNYFKLYETLEVIDFYQRATFPVNFLFPTQLRYLLIAAVLLLLNRKNSFFKITAAILIAASVLVDGHQIVIGRNLEADHWISRVLAPMGTFALLLIFNTIIIKFVPKFDKAIWILIAMTVSMVAITKQMDWIKAYEKDLQINLEVARIANEIKQNTPKNAVIGSLSPQISKHITGLTGRWVYVAPGNKSIVNSNEQLDRICDLLVLIDRDAKINQISELVTYSLGFKVRGENISSEIVQIQNCLDSPQHAPRYKLDYLLEEENGQWNLVSLTNN